MYIDYLGSNLGGPYLKREENSFFVFGLSGYFWHTIRPHKCAKYLKIIAFLKSSDMYIYHKNLKNWRLLWKKRGKSCFKFAG